MKGVSRRGEVALGAEEEAATYLQRLLEQQREEWQRLWDEQREEMQRLRDEQREELQRLWEQQREEMQRLWEQQREEMQKGPAESPVGAQGPANKLL